MKRHYLAGYNVRPESPPARGRGLKPPVTMQEKQAMFVAPRTGAWIETGRG